MADVAFEQKTLDIREMLLGGPNRLRYVIRFSTCYRAHDESVAEHCFYVAFFCAQIIDWVHLHCPRLDVNEALVLRRALMHDLEEARSGDFPRPFKHSSAELKSHLDAAGAIALQKTVRPLWSNYASRVEYWTREWEFAKDTTLEGRILEFADFLSCLSYLLQEMQGSNRTVGEHVESMKSYVSVFASEAFKFVRPLVDQAIELLERELGYDFSK